VWALRRRGTNIIDQWNGTKYIRILTFNNEPIKIAVRQEGTISEPKIAIALQGKKRAVTPVRIQKDARLLVRKMLGLDRDLTPLYILARKNNDAVLISLGQQFLGVKPPCFPSIFETLINAIACQQVTLDLAILMLNRLSVKFGLEFEDDVDETLLHAFPRPEDLADVSEQEMRKLGFSRQKARAIKELAMAVVDDETKLSNLSEMTNEQIVEYLSSIRGIGRWSAEYALLRGFGRIDTFPGDDIGAQNNLEQLFRLDKKPDYTEVKKLTSRWHPYEGLVYFHLLLNKLHMRGVI
jgi:DNA-3-methyladenine glycosylase II